MKNFFCLELEADWAVMEYVAAKPEPPWVESVGVDEGGRRGERARRTAGSRVVDLDGIVLRLMVRRMAKTATSVERRPIGKAVFVVSQSRCDGWVNQVSKLMTTTPSGYLSSALLVAIVFLLFVTMIRQIFISSHQFLYVVACCLQLL